MKKFITKSEAIEFADLHCINIGQTSIELDDDWKEKIELAKLKIECNFWDLKAKKINLEVENILSKINFDSVR